MAVTKIRKLSSWTLLISFLISIVVLLMFFCGGVVDPAAENKEYVYTGLLLDWTYVIFFVTIAALIILGLWQFGSLLKTNPKSALSSAAVIVLFFVMLAVTYSLGDGTPLQGLNADSQAYNIPFWLKTTDMWILSTIVLFVLIVAVICLGTIKRIFNR